MMDFVMTGPALSLPVLQARSLNERGCLTAFCPSRQKTATTRATRANLLRAAEHTVLWRAWPAGRSHYKVTRHEEDITGAGYDLLESLPEQVRPPDPGTGQHSLPELERRIQRFRSELAGLRGELGTVENDVRSAVEAEDAEQVARTWNEKHRLLSRISELQREQAGVEGRLATELERQLRGVEQEHAGLCRDLLEEDAAWEALLAAAERMVQGLRQFQMLRQRLNARQQALHERLQRLASREGSDSMGPVAHRPARRARPRSPLLERERMESSRQWALYDPDAGKLVETLPELLRLLARWYPAVRDDRERVREFLRLPNAEPLPDKLRQELHDGGSLSSENAGESTAL